MTDQFFEKPILNSPYDYPSQHWELDEKGQPTQKILQQRRPAEFVSLVAPIPKPKKRRQGQDDEQQTLAPYDTAGISDEQQKYDLSLFINSVREKVNAWRRLPNPVDWKVTPETARLLQHWRHHKFQSKRPFFCQVEAVETAIWLAEVASSSGKKEKAFLEHVVTVNQAANPELLRVALKLATGAGKTTVMSMLIAWQVVNAVRHPQSSRYTRGFLIVAPGITIRDRLRVLQPNDPNSYYAERELVPNDMLADLQKAKIVITNYHAFKLRERVKLASGTRKLIQGRGPELNTLETEGQMLQRVMPELMGMKNILVLNDEAHHCYREKPDTDDENSLKGDDKKEAKKNNEAARLWISGIEIIKRKIGVQKVYDLSATPFFLRGSGYAEGTLFPWTVSDFSLMDAIECGIVKLPRVPVADNIPGGEMPKFRELWKHISKRMPKKGRGKAKVLDPLSLPTELQTALDALYGHYEKTYQIWKEQNIGIPPVFIVVCNNTSTSKLVHDYIAGFFQEGEDESRTFNAGRLELFRNYDEYGERLARPRTLLIDSEQLESGESLDKGFRAMAADEIDRFRYEIGQRDGGVAAAKITDQDLLREVMNTVGEKGKLGESIRCVVSVSMLTEGWDCNTVTHVLGVRAFGTQLLCEQVIGRALRRQSYELNEEGKFHVEYADVLGIPFDFTAKPMVAKPVPPRQTVAVKAVRPDRDGLEIRFPRVEGYRVELPDTRITASFSEDSVLELTPNLVGPSTTRNEGIIGKGVDLTVEHLKEMRESTVLFELTKHLIYNQYREVGEEPKLNLFGQFKRVTRQWMKGYLRCIGGTYPAQLCYKEIADMACERIKNAITEATGDDKPVKAILDAYNPVGSTVHVKLYYL
ncbi:Type III restriction enzyme, res subunit family [Synechococcus sp. PCC 7335]|uniref:BPTD_3080 family restriction endonuclease n=1 Tax=Synechococcus sp. (strain ATCC 29403 / PCC 7335) TaxID=91464 RepID=UPI00017EE3DD|nr:DEAD/DEAH box helicase family protein [Synechococcus sp. PCC 7335]EDX86856.1 Type III restriction enzyme, res subunit family [Synechococcus sp. PCC 7335]